MDMQFYLTAGLAFLVAFAVAFVATPPVTKFAYILGAVDVPRDNRRMHKEPLPRLGGLAIFAGFLVALLIFGEMDRAMTGVLIGALIIVTLGILDDIFRLQASLRFVVEIAAALVPVLYGGLRIETLSNFSLFGGEPYFYLRFFSIPVTVLWIVGLTNAVNWIDGLDGLAAGVSSIAAISLLVISCMLEDVYVAMVMAVLAGAVIGFLPYNMNPAKIIMGDTGSTFLGYILATMSIQGLFKFYAVVSFAVPFLMIGLPIFDMVTSALRRIATGRLPWAADREHVHHKLIDMGLNQKQAVAVLYAFSAILGIAAVILASSGAEKAVVLLAAVLLSAIMGFRYLTMREKKAHIGAQKPTPETLPEGQTAADEEKKGKKPQSPAP